MVITQAAMRRLVCALHKAVGLGIVWEAAPHAHRLCGPMARIAHAGGGFTAHSAHDYGRGNGDAITVTVCAPSALSLGTLSRNLTPDRRVQIGNYALNAWTAPARGYVTNAFVCVRVACTIRSRKLKPQCRK